MYTYQEKIFLGALLIILSAIGLLSPIEDKTNPTVFSQSRDFFLININTAGAEELKILPYISDRLAREIIKYRLEKGRIGSTDELLNIKGIGPTRIKRIKKYLRL
jgi:competence ComEA-like helix-hairpin-helix protein